MKKAAKAEVLLTPTQGSSSEGAVALQHHVTECVRRYLDEIGSEDTSGFYHLVLEQVEAPLLREVMRHVGNNQSRAAQMLGLNRGTLRKKLRLYGIDCNGTD